MVTINLPALRERKTDIPVLIRHFIHKYSLENHKKVEGISKEAQDYLMKYNFPGNIRELENIIERAVVLAREELIITSDLPAGLSIKTEKQLLDSQDFNNSYGTKVSAFETEMINNALELKSGNQSKAAELLGMSERHLRSRMQKLGIINTKR